MAFLKTEFMLADTFEATGEWWLPENPIQKVFGTLRRSATMIELELSGDFESVEVTNIATGTAKFPFHPCIHGESNEGKKFTLLKAGCIERGTTAKYSAVYMVVNKLAPDISTLKLKSAHVYCQHLDDFIAASGLFDGKQELNGGEFKSVSVTFRQPTKALWRIDALATVFELDVECRASYKRMSVKLAARTFAHFLPDAPQDIEWFITKTWRLCYLLTLLTDERVSPTGIRIEIEGEPSPCWLLYRAGKEEADYSDRAAPIFLSHLGHTLEGFQEILTRWFTVDEMMLDGIHLMMDAQRNQGHSTHGRFLLLAHAVEVVSRATTRSEYMPQHDYEKVISTMNMAIPREVDSDHRMSLKSKIKYGNEFAFHKRIKVLLETLSDKGRGIVCKDPGKFCRGISDTRNYYTHFTDELRPKALPPVSMYWASEKLSFLVRIVLLRYLGIPEEVIVERMSGHQRLMQRILLSKEHPEVMAAGSVRGTV